MELMVLTSAHTVTTQTFLPAAPLPAGIWPCPCPFPLLIWHLLSRCGRARESNRNSLRPDLAEHTISRLAVAKAWVFQKFDNRLQNLSQRLGGSIWFGTFHWIGRWWGRK